MLSCIPLGCVKQSRVKSGDTYSADWHDLEYHLAIMALWVLQCQTKRRCLVPSQFLSFGFTRSQRRFDAQVCRLVHTGYLLMEVRRGRNRLFVSPIVSSY